MTDLQERLRLAELLLKLVTAVRTRTLLAKSNPALRPLTKGDTPGSTAQPQAGQPDMLLTKEEEDEASAALENSAVYLAACQLDAVLEESIPNRFEHDNHDIRAACSVIRLLQESFAANPFDPVWKFPDEWKGKLLEFEGLSFFPPELDGRPVRRRDYGGPMTLLRLIEFVQGAIKKGS